MFFDECLLDDLQEKAAEAPRLRVRPPLKL